MAILANGIESNNPPSGGLLLSISYIFYYNTSMASP